MLGCLLIVFLTSSSGHSESIAVPVIGESKAKVTIIVYSDFQCVYCAHGHATLKELFKKYKGQIKIAFKHYPLKNIHPWAEDAAAASICAFQQDPKAFWKIADYFFKNQARITKESLPSQINEFANRANLDVSALRSCMNDPSTKQKISSDAAEAEKRGLSSTPAFLVNGKTILGAQSVDYFSEVIDQALAEVQ